MGVSKGIKSKRVPVMVDEEQYNRIKSFNQQTGVPIARVVRDSINSYMEVQAAARLERIEEIQKAMTSKVVCINSSGEVKPLESALAECVIPPAS